MLRTIAYLAVRVTCVVLHFGPALALSPNSCAVVVIVGLVLVSLLLMGMWRKCGAATGNLMKRLSSLFSDGMTADHHGKRQPQGG